MADLLTKIKKEKIERWKVPTDKDDGQYHGHDDHAK
jgi:hypothetical protein